MKTLCLCLLMVGFVADSRITAASRLIPFQGRLSDSSGKAVADGVRMIQFQIFSEPNSGSVLWTGEAHRATINGGLVNVVLGSKNPLPNDRLDQPDKSFFDQPLYLQITVDADLDNQITADDPPLLPRQAILPVLFASEAASSRTLNGYDWSVLFGTNNPVDGKLFGAKLANASVGTAQLADAAITRDKLAAQAAVRSFNGLAGDVSLAVGPGTIIETNANGIRISASAVTSDRIATNAVNSPHIAAGAVSQDKLAPGLFRTASYSWNNTSPTGPQYNTGQSTTLWYPILSGFDFGTGDLQENDTGALGGVWFTEVSGTWRINAGLRTHNNYPNITVDVLWIPRRLVQ